MSENFSLIKYNNFYQHSTIQAVFPSFIATRVLSKNDFSQNIMRTLNQSEMGTMSNTKKQNETKEEASESISVSDNLFRKFIS